MPDITIPDLDILGIAAVLAALGVLWALLRRANHMMRRLNQFADDWFGTDGDENHPPKRGIVARMDLAEEQRAALSDDVAAVKAKVDHELDHNSGSSTKDAAHEALRVVKEVQVQQEAEIIARRDWHRRYESDQLAQQARLMTFFALVRRMIPLPPDQQALLWDRAVEAAADGTLTDEFPPDDKES
jgi:hypothetical protein